MDFIHEPYVPGETIAAIATPLGEGGVAIVRVTGSNAIAVADRVFSGDVASYATHTAHYGRVVDGQGRAVDDALVLVMKGKRSYAGEDTVEIHCHGGSLITRRVLEVVLAAGARMARPGEFTFRAFMNGKLDLAQAEAVQELIGAKNDLALDAAEAQLQGRLSFQIRVYQERLTALAAILEAWVDFPEEGIEFASMEEVMTDLAQVKDEMQGLVNTFHDGRIVHEGVALALVGCPNVGKSSLMNALLDKERAIVTDIAGTTRDVVEDHCRLNGLNIRLIDTAGIRDVEEIVEREGIRRSRLAMKEADLVLWVLDANRGFTAEDAALLAEIPSQQTIAVWNKVDLPHAELPSLDVARAVALSAKEGKGLEHLRQAIDEVVWKAGPPSREELVLTSSRHREALSESVESVERLIEGLRLGVSPEFLTMDVRQALTALGKIIGTNVGEDILSSIFATFCIGK